MSTDWDLLSKHRVLAERHWKVDGDQTWNYELIRKTASGVRLRVRIERNAYDRQSDAFVQQWDGHEWHRVTTWPISQCACRRVSYVETNGHIDLFREDAAGLLKEALAITGDQP